MDSTGSNHLFIDTHERGVIGFALIPTDVHRKIVSRRIEGSRELLREAEAFFGSSLERARGIIVVAGPGSFSSIRSGVLAANMMSRMMRIPLYGVNAEGLACPERSLGELSLPRAEPRGAESRIDLESVRRQIIEGALKPVRYVAPIYDQEPNITVKG
jgi:hypothetical protein